MSEAKRERSEAQGGETVDAGRSDNRSYVGERRLTNDGGQTYQYDATGQQTYASGTGLEQHYDGDGLRVKKTEQYLRTYYVRSSVLGNQVIVELESAGNFQRGYVYLGGQLLALQQSGTVNWVHQDPVTKSQRVTDVNGAVTTTKIDLDPWGGETIASANTGVQPQRFTTYTRDANGGDDAQMRRYSGVWQRFAQPDPYDGSANLSDPQSFNRYSYVQNDPVNFTDPTGLDDFPIWWWTNEDGSLGTYFNMGVTVGGSLYPGGGAGGARYSPILDVTGPVGGNIRSRVPPNSIQDHTSPGRKPSEEKKGTICPPVSFKVTGIAPGQAPGTTAISRTPRADIPNGGVAIKPGNFGVSGINGNNRSVILGMSFTVDWSTSSVGVPSGIPTEGPFFPVDNIGPRSVRIAPGNMIDVYNYTSKQQALGSTRTVMITTYIPANSVGVTCPKGN